MQCFRGSFVAAFSAVVIASTTRALAQSAVHEHAPQTTDPNVDAQGLAREVRLETVLEVAQRANPEIHEAQERVLSATARASSAGRLPDLEAKYEQWGVPLARPYALDEAGTLMLGLRQTIPAPGVLGARSRAAGGEATSITAPSGNTGFTWSTSSSSPTSSSWRGRTTRSGGLPSRTSCVPSWTFLASTATSPISSSSSTAARLS